MPVGVELKPNSKFGSGGPLRNHVGNECGSCRQRKWRSLHHVELICSAPKQEVIRSAGNTRSKSTIRQWWLLANRARVSNPPDCADPGLHPDRRRDHVAKRPNTGRTATRASVGRRHLLSSFVHRLRTRPRLSRAKRQFGGSTCTPRMCWSPSPLRPRDYRLQKGGTTCTWPAQWFLFSISDPKKRCAQ